MSSAASRSPAPPHYRIPAYLLVPEGKGPFPGVVALHDHGGWFFHGKEKLVEVSNQHVSLNEFKQRYYGNRSFASELARRGYVVLVADAFYWGERRLQYADPPADYRKAIAGLDPATPEYVQAVNGNPPLPLCRTEHLAQLLRHQLARHREL